MPAASAIILRRIILHVCLAAAVLVCVLMLGAAAAAEQAPAPMLVTVFPGVTIDVSALSLPAAVVVGLGWLGWQINGAVKALLSKDLRGLVEVKLTVVAPDTTRPPSWDGGERRAPYGGAYPRPSGEVG